MPETRKPYVLMLTEEEQKFLVDHIDALDIPTRCPKVVDQALEGLARPFRSQEDRLVELYTDLDEGRVSWDDVHEWVDVEYRERYGLDNDHVAIAYNYIQSFCDTRYNVQRRDPGVLMSTLKEADHENYDGWSDYHKLVIQAFLADLSRAAAVQEEEKKKS